jgi:hypothetical protein
MTDILKSTARYEDWLRRQLGADLVEKDLERKHKKMRDSAFSFLRATYWRWAETVLDACPKIAEAPRVLAVGDIHLENYGTWRDADGRLVWGVNDFDEAAEMPYAVDLIRLATSALIANEDESADTAGVCTAILRGYTRGLSAPQPVVLDRDMQWLREAVVVSEKSRAKFWRKIDEQEEEVAPQRYREALAAAMPEPGLSLRTQRRTAGTGSLGRPRWVGLAQWRGATVVREAKALLPSAWALAQGHATALIHSGQAAGGRFRPIDPWLHIADGISVRRLSPNNRKIEADDDIALLLAPAMLEAMAADLAAVHLGTGNAASASRAITADLTARKDGWLLTHAKAMAVVTERDFEAWKAAAPSDAPATSAKKK